MLVALHLPTTPPPPTLCPPPVCSRLRAPSSFVVPRGLVTLLPFLAPQASRQLETLPMPVPAASVPPLAPQLILHPCEPTLNPNNPPPAPACPLYFQLGFGPIQCNVPRCSLGKLLKRYFFPQLTKSGLYCCERDITHCQCLALHLTQGGYNTG